MYGKNGGTHTVQLKCAVEKNQLDSPHTYSALHSAVQQSMAATERVKAMEIACVFSISASSPWPGKDRWVYRDLRFLEWESEEKKRCLFQLYTIFVAELSIACMFDSIPGSHIPSALPARCDIGKSTHVMKKSLAAPLACVEKVRSWWLSEICAKGLGPWLSVGMLKRSR